MLLIPRLENVRATYLSQRLLVLCCLVFDTFTAPYQHSWRQPEFYLKPRHQALPTLVVESGWAESYPSLIQDKDLWLIGGSPHVNVVFVFEWSKSPRNRIRGRLGVYRKQGGLVQVESILPAHLFTSSLPAGHSSCTLLMLKIVLMPS